MAQGYYDRSIAILDALYAKADKVDSDENGDKVFDIRFKKSGNVWTITYTLRWCGNRVGFRRHAKVVCNDIEKHFKSIDTLAHAIAAGYIK